MQCTPSNKRVLELSTYVIDTIKLDLEKKWLSPKKLTKVAQKKTKKKK